MEQIRRRSKKRTRFLSPPDPVSSYERYGVDFDDFSKIADRFCVVCLAKLCHAMVLGDAYPRLQKNPQKPFHIAFYVYGSRRQPADVPPPTEVLTVSTRCVRVGGLEGFLYLVDGEKEMSNFQKSAIEKPELISRLRTFGGNLFKNTWILLRTGKNSNNNS